MLNSTPFYTIPLHLSAAAVLAAHWEENKQKEEYLVLLQQKQEIQQKMTALEKTLVSVEVVYMEALHKKDEIDRKAKEILESDSYAKFQVLHAVAPSIISHMTGA